MNSSSIISLPLLIAALMAIVIAGAGGLFIYTNQSNQVEELDNTPMETNRPTPVVVIESTAAVPSTALVTPTPSAEIQPTPQPKSSNVYTHARYGFTMTLPTGWSGKEGNVSGGLDGSPPLPSLYDKKKSTYIIFSSPQGANGNGEVRFSVTCLTCWSASRPQVTLNDQAWHRRLLDEKIYYYTAPPFASHVYYIFQATADQEAELKQLLSTFKFIR